jgi:hypothetical protein
MHQTVLIIFGRDLPSSIGLPAARFGLDIQQYLARFNTHLFCAWRDGIRRQLFLDVVPRPHIRRRPVGTAAGSPIRHRASLLRKQALQKSQIARTVPPDPCRNPEDPPETPL